MMTSNPDEARNALLGSQAPLPRHAAPRSDLQQTLSGLPPNRRRELEVARAVAEEAGRVLVDCAGKVVGERKADGTLVTEADRRVDRLIRDRLSVAFPGDELISEEIGTGYRGARRAWVIDPLDGTANFCAGVPLWGVTMALVVDGRPVVGVSLFPKLGMSFCAVEGAGAWLGERRLWTLDRADYGAADLIAMCSRTPRHFALDLEARRRVLGSAALNFALVAAGTFRASISATARLWDLAAGWLIVEQASGVVHVLDGPSPWPLEPGDYAARAFPTLASATAAIHAQTRLRVRAHPHLADEVAPADGVAAIVRD